MKSLSVSFAGTAGCCRSLLLAVVVFGGRRRLVLVCCLLLELGLGFGVWALFDYLLGIQGPVYL